MTPILLISSFKKKFSSVVIIPCLSLKFESRETKTTNHLLPTRRDGHPERLGDTKGDSVVGNVTDVWIVEGILSLLDSSRLY